MFRPFRNIVALLFFVALYPIKAFSQNKRIDSMENDLKHPRNDTSRFSLLVNLALEYYEYDSSKAYRYLEQAHSLAAAAKYNYELGSYYQNKGTFTELRSYYPKALLLYDTAIQYYQKAVDARK